MEGKICRIEGCTNILTKTSGQICQSHRSRWFRHKSYDISPNWTGSKKGQPSLTNLGYFRIHVDGKRVLQHRYIMEQHLGRKLRKLERVHHINGVKTDNRIENLMLCKNNAEHILNHHHSRPTTYSKKDVSEITRRCTIKTGTHKECFCGSGNIIGHNLCSKHYQWAIRRDLISNR